MLSHYIAVRPLFVRLHNNNNRSCCFWCLFVGQQLTILSFFFILCSKSLLNSLSVRPSELRLAVVKDTTLPFLNFSCCCLRLMVLPFGHLIRTCSLENSCFLKRIILLRLIRIYSVVIIALFLQPVRTVSGLYVLLQPGLWNRIKIEQDGLLQGQCSR